MILMVVPRAFKNKVFAIPGDLQQFLLTEHSSIIPAAAVPYMLSVACKCMPTLTRGYVCSELSYIIQIVACESLFFSVCRSYAWTVDSQKSEVIVNRQGYSYHPTSDQERKHPVVEMTLDAYEREWKPWKRLYGLLPVCIYVWVGAAFATTKSGCSRNK
jgi:hypothetical protein